jgi:hypothetical protein
MKCPLDNVDHRHLVTNEMLPKKNSPAVTHLKVV